MMPNDKSLKPFFVLWTGQAISLLGSQLVQFALIWWLTQTTGSATVLALASLAGMLPNVVLGPFVGVLIDRWNRRLTLMAADSVVALATIVLAYLFWADVVQIWHVFVILFVRSLGGGFHRPAMQASTSLMVPEAQLTRIQGLNQALNGGMNIASAPLGALLLGVLPIQGILAIDVVTAVFAIGPLFFIAVPQPKKKAQSPDDKSSFWADMEAGLRYVKGWPAILVLMGMSMMINLVLSPTFSLIPLLVTDHFGGDAMQLGFLDAAAGAGIVTGGLLLGAWGGFKRRIVTSLTGLIGIGVGTLLIGFAPVDAFFMAVIGAVLVGSMLSLANGPIMAIFQACIEPEMQGRVFTLLTSLASGMAPLGLVIAGPAADMLGVQAWFIVGGFVTLLMGLIGFMLPMLLRVEDGRISSQLVTAVAD
ncbi:MAG: MFS transporter [Ardenticatenaceae bacterium]|nr:MFS transporter [Ardenticatenaceae bacterium]MCB9445542.1 MFS transporter [Ardenticatenaceae bacterium]